MNEGNKLIPTQWIEVDKAEHKRREGGTYVPPEFKSRLVACGNFEDTPGIRTDSPTCDLEGLNLLVSWAASNALRLNSADIRNAYFQGKELDRLLLLSPPKCGLPDPDYADGETMIVARAPIYGTPDAGRFFWKQLFSSSSLSNPYL